MSGIRDYWNMDVTDKNAFDAHRAWLRRLHDHPQRHTRSTPTPPLLKRDKKPAHAFSSKAGVAYEKEKRLSE